MNWNYRVMKRKNESGEYEFGIYEVMIQYYIELQKGSDLEFEKDPVRFRLQNDKISWKRVTHNELEKSDLLTHDVYELIKLQEFDQAIELDGELWTINPKVQSKNRLYYHVYSLRDIFPKTPGKEQVHGVGMII